MSTEYYDHLLEKATWGHITDQEVEKVVAALSDPQPEVDPYSLLYIIGRSERKSYRPVIESYLAYQQDPMLARLSLQILCHFWGLTVDYLEEVRQFLHGVSWDRYDDIRLMAMSISGFYLSQSTDIDLLEELIRIYENANEDPLFRETAYLCLMKAIQFPKDKIPPISRPFDPENDTNFEVIDNAKSRLLAEKGKS